MSAALDWSAFAHFDPQRPGLVVAVVRAGSVDACASFGSAEPGGVPLTVSSRGGGQEPGSSTHGRISEVRRAAVGMLSIRDALGVFERGEHIGQPRPAAPQRPLANRVIRRMWADQRRRTARPAIAA